MKYILVILLMLVVVSGFSQKKQIKSVTEIKFDKNDEPKHKIIEEFDNDSVLIKHSYYNGDFDLMSYRTFTAQVNQERTEISYNGDDEIDELDTIRYNPDGEIIYYSRQHFRDNKISFHFDEYDFDYDQSCNILTEYRIEDGHNGWVYYYEYNDQNQIIKKYSEYDAEPGEEYTYLYENGILVEEKLFDFNNEELKKSDNTFWYYIYKKNKLSSKKVHSVADYLENTIIDLYTYSYNRNGTLKEISQFEDGEYDGKKVFSYTYYE